MTSSNSYRPTDEFRENLEWEVLRRHRRNVRERTQRSVRSVRFAKAAVIVIVSGSIGATAGFASAQSRQNSARDSLLTAERANAMLATTRYEISKAEADDVSLKVRVGAADQSALDDAVAELRDMEARRKATGLNIQEITASGQAPRDDLGAPLVAGHDYVKERIALQLSALQAKLSAAEQDQALAERRFRLTGQDEGSLTNAQLTVIRAQGQLSVLAERMNLRNEFLQHGTPAPQLDLRLTSVQLHADILATQAELSAAKARLQIVQKRQAVGAAGDVDLLKAELEVKELELEIQRMATRKVPEQ
ncbi:MAG TPA: hypothetical protein VGM67_17480 [Gemmatimonadaceae bacterium]|jgi:hypothetical protein